MKTPGEVTALLLSWRRGDRFALEHLVPLIERDLRHLARAQMAGERPGHLLQPTALVNEAFLRLVDITGVEWQDRAHFFAVAARVMRRVLVETARAQQYQKRGGGALHVSFDEVLSATTENPAWLIALDDALRALSAVAERKAKVVELRHFGGLTVEETAEVMGVSVVTVLRDWRFAKVWLLRELSGHRPAAAASAHQD